MADPDPEREQSPVVPPGSSSEPGLNSGAPSPDIELQAGGQGVLREEEVEEALEEGGADGALMKPKPLLHLHRGTDHTDSLTENIDKVGFKTNVNSKPTHTSAFL